MSAPTIERAATLIAEAEAAALVFMAALAAQGLRLVTSSLLLWEDVQVTPTKTNPSSVRWLNKVLGLIGERRQDARALAFSYFRYTRALRTGYTVPALNTPSQGTTVDLRDLRDDFYTQVDNSAPSLTYDPPPRTNQSIKVEKIPDLDDDLDALDEQADKEARDVLVTLGPLNLQKMLKEINDDEPATQVDVLRVAAHRHAGSRQAAAAERVVLNAGRDALQTVADKDTRVLGYVRLSRTGTPCGFCAMLIARGPVYFSKSSGDRVSAKGARRGKRAEGEQFHDNCHCYTEPVYTDEAFENEDLFKLNREYQTLWPTVVGRLKGKEALTKWRRYFRDREKANA